MEEQILSRNRSLEMCCRTVTTESFIEEAKQIYGDLYDYCKVQYINRDHKVTITCPVHGDFRVYAREHLDGKRCPMCVKSDKFIKKLTDRFGNQFGLDKLVYRDSTTPVTLICPEHGEFTSMPQSILSSKYGCPMCAQKVNESTHEEAERRKAAMKKAKEEERYAWVDKWYSELQKCQNERWSIINNWDFSKSILNINLFDEVSLLDPFDAYKLIVDVYIDIILRGNKRQRSLLGVVPLTDSEAQRLSNYRVGDTYYLFQGQAAIKNVKRYVYENYNANEQELCRELSHRNCHISFLGEDLLIRAGRKVISGDMKYLAETFQQFDNLRNTGLSVFICAKDSCFNITDDISMEEERYKDDPIMWVSVPFDNNCSDRIIKYACDKHLAFLYMYGIFRTSTENTIYNYLEIGTEQSFIGVAKDLDLAPSTIKTAIRAFEKAGVIETQRYGDFFTVLSKNVKELEPSEVKKDYQSLVDSIKELSNDISSDNASFITNIRRSCQSNPKVLLNLPKSFVSIDFEKYYSQAISACSVGLVKFINGEIVDRYYTLIRPPFENPLLNGLSLERINNITRNMLEGERPFNEILPEMEDFIGGLPLVAHNAYIERDCIAKTAKYYGMSTYLPVNDIIDTYRLALDVEAVLDLKVERRKHAHSLDTVCTRFNVPLLEHHNALDDAIMCGNLLLALSASAEGKSIVQPVEVTHIERPKIKPEDKQQRTDFEDIVDNPFKNKVVVLTGFSRDNSQTYAHKLHELGAIIKDSVTKKTNILITGYNAGPSKLAKAQELGVDILPEDNFLTIIKSYE